MGTSPTDHVWEAINGLREDIKGLMISGCAKRNGDVQRVDALEEAHRDQADKINRIYYISLVASGGIIMLLLKSLLSYISGVKQ